MDSFEAQDMAHMVMLMQIIARYRETHPEIVDTIVLHVVAAGQAPEHRRAHIEAAMREARKLAE